MDKYKSEIIRKSGISSSDVTKAESDLHLIINKNLKEYLINYGALSFRSMELMGLGYSDGSYRNIINATKKARADSAIPLESLVIEDIGESHYILCNNDGSISYWGNGNEIDKVDSSISEYIKRRIKEELG